MGTLEVLDIWQCELFNFVCDKATSEDLCDFIAECSCSRAFSLATDTSFSLHARHSVCSYQRRRHSSPRYACLNPFIPSDPR